ncbi:PRC-barrel domain-containing protein [Sabulicella rubraurantiaca]|uniref:PRC-barrel domain-containing protein n=1 Tax=Sabulicella rubraurantiaca TaxID=2811429 RepID=UPI001A9650ED|nr:PRC-barrel domain-containing protein [Sabulicella rubraurantiaca]
MTIHRSLSLLATAALLAGTPLAYSQTRPDGAPGNPPSTATGRAVDRAQGEVPRPDGTPGNPPGTAVGRAVDSTLGTNTTGANPSGAATGATTTPATTSTSPMTVDAASLRGALSARRLIDADIYGANDREVGEVEDVIIPQGGTGGLVVVLSVGGFLGMGERHVAVPFSQLQHNADRNRWVLPNATEETLRAMPVFNLDEFGRNRNRANSDRPRRDSVTGTTTDGAASRPGASGGTSVTPAPATPANPPTR